MMAKNDPPVQNVMTNNGIAVPVWVKWFSLLAGAASQIRANGTIEPASLADADAENNSIYYSTTASRLVYKDSGGTVNNLY